MYVVVIVSKKSSFKYMDHTCWNKPQGQKNDTPGRPSEWIFELQIKNIKLHIVTDIKVTFNSMFGFRISIFGWGDGYFMQQRKY